MPILTIELIADGLCTARGRRRCRKHAAGAHNLTRKGGLVERIGSRQDVREGAQSERSGQRLQVQTVVVEGGIRPLAGDLSDVVTEAHMARAEVVWNQFA